MIYALVGHKGVGKTAFLDRLKTHYNFHRRAVTTFEIDEEAAHRPETFTNILKQSKDLKGDIVIVVGEEFLGQFPDEVHVVWLTRPNFQSSFQLDKVGATHEVFEMPEGELEPNLSESIFWGLSNAQLGGALALTPDNFINEMHFRHFIEKRLRWGIDYFELKDNLLDEEMVRMALASIPHEKLLFSFRDPESTAFDHVTTNDPLWDWPLELGACSKGKPRILSLHNRELAGSLVESIGLLEKSAHPETHLKLAIRINDFSELLLGHKWWSEDPTRRSFLPRSESGRWSWYRLLQKGKMKLNFFRELTHGVDRDNPVLADWVLSPWKTVKWAAIIGESLDSNTMPAKYRKFFSDHHSVAFRVPTQSAEWDAEAIKILAVLGFRYGEIVGTLAKKSRSLCQKMDNSAKVSDSVNTVYWDEASKSLWGAKIEGNKSRFWEAPSKWRYE